MDYVGEYIGADDVEEMLAELELAGLDDDEIGAARRRMTARRRGGRGRGSIPQRAIAPLSSDGRPRQFPLMMSRSVGLADAGTATLTGTADRRAMLQGLFIEGNSAAGAQVFGVSVTSITVNGRNCVIGSGFVPAALCFGEFAQSAEQAGQWYFGVIEQGGTANIGVQNDSGAAADIYCGFRTETTDA